MQTNQVVSTIGKISLIPPEIDFRCTTIHDKFPSENLMVPISLKTTNVISTFFSNVNMWQSSVQEFSIYVIYDILEKEKALFITLRIN